MSCTPTVQYIRFCAGWTKLITMNVNVIVFIWETIVFWWEIVLTNLEKLFVYRGIGKIILRYRVLRKNLNIFSFRCILGCCTFNEIKIQVYHVQMFTLVTFDNIVGIFCKNLFFVINCKVYIIVYTGENSLFYSTWKQIFVRLKNQVF